MKNKKSFILSMFFCTQLGTLTLDSSAKSIEDGRVWLTYTADHQINPTWKTALQIQPYWRNEGRTNDQVTARAGVYYQLSSDFSLGGGYAYALGHPNAHHDSHENRLWEDFIYRIDNSSDLQCSMRARFEHRHFEHQGSMLHGARLLLKLSQPINQHLSILASDEYYVNINSTEQGESGFDQNRLFLGISSKLSSESSVEFGYINQFSKRSDANAENHILAFTLNQSF